MSTESDTVTKKPPGRRINRNIIVLGGVFGLVYLVIGLIQGKPVVGLVAMGFMLMFVALYFFGAKHSDTVALMGDDVHDERHVHIHQRAALITVNVLGVALAVGTIIDVMRGGNGTPYIWFIVISVATYFGVVFVLSRRN